MEIEEIEAKIWFKNVMLNCSKIQLNNYQDSIFWLYDKSLETIRNNVKTDIEDGTLLFEQRLVYTNQESIYDDVNLDNLFRIPKDVKFRNFFVNYENCYRYINKNFNSRSEGELILKLIVNEVLDTVDYEMEIFFNNGPNEIFNILKKAYIRKKKFAKLWK